MRDKESPIGGMRGFKKIETVQRFPKPGGEFPSSKVSIGWIRSHMACLYNFLDCVSQGKKAKPSFKDGMELQELMDKVRLSSERKSWIDIQ